MWPNNADFSKIPENAFEKRSRNVQETFEKRSRNVREAFEALFRAFAEDLPVRSKFCGVLADFCQSLLILLFFDQKNLKKLL